MKVNFKRDFFTNEGRFRERDNPHEVPDTMKGNLPSDIEIVGKPVKDKHELKPKNSRAKEKA